MTHETHSSRDTLRDLPVEHALLLEVGGERVATLICTPDRLEDLAAGWTYSQGLAVGADTEISIAEAGGGVSVARIEAEQPDVPAWRGYVLAGFDASTLVSKVPARLGPGAAFDAVRFEDRLKEAFDAFRERRGAGGYHHAALVSEAEVLDVVKDISRHNAVDKVVGGALRRALAPERLAIVLSGRISADIALKGARLGAPVIATRSLATREAAKLAVEAEIMLICRALDHRRVTFGASRLVQTGT